jgi:hypothetical protein
MELLLRSISTNFCVAHVNNNHVVLRPVGYFTMQSVSSVCRGRAVDQLETTDGVEFFFTMFFGKCPLSRPKNRLQNDFRTIF